MTCQNTFFIPAIDCRSHSRHSKLRSDVHRIIALRQAILREEANDDGFETGGGGEGDAAGRAVLVSLETIGQRVVYRGAVAIAENEAHVVVAVAGRDGDAIGIVHLK